MVWRRDTGEIKRCAKHVVIATIFIACWSPVSRAEEPVGPTESEVIQPSGEIQPDLAYGAFQRGNYLTAFQLALPRANLGDPAAQTLIAEMYERGLGVARNRQEAAEWYRIAANSGNREAQFAYAIKLIEGKHVERDMDLATELLKVAANSGHPQAQFNYAQRLLEIHPGHSGFVKAFPYIKKAADASVPEAYYAMAKIYESGKGSIAPDTKAARNWLILAARNGVDTAQVELAIQLANGLGGQKDEVSAFAWFQRAAFTGNVIAQNRLAKMYALGIGTKANVIEAAKWYILSRRAGRSDLWLKDFVDSLSEKDRAAALEAANYWRTR